MQDARCKDLLRDVAFIGKLVGFRLDAEVIGQSLSHAGARGDWRDAGPLFLFYLCAAGPRQQLFNLLQGFRLG